MTDKDQPQPPREPWEVVTPFGNATVHDSRGLDGSMCATVTFHKPIINRKQYTDDVTVYLERRPAPSSAGVQVQTWWNVRPSFFSPLTDNAAHKLREFLDEMTDKFDVYRAPLPPEEIRARKLHSYRRTLANDLSAIMSRGGAELADLAIVLREALESVEHGKVFRA